MAVLLVMAGGVVADGYGDGEWGGRGRRHRGRKRENKGREKRGNFKRWPPIF